MDSKTYIFHEDDNLALCPVLQFLALAFADDAFEAPNLKSPEHIFQLKVEHPRESLQLRWKDSMLETPIFRRAVRTPSGIRTSINKALTYDSFYTYLKRLGRSTGFPQILTSYKQLCEGGIEKKFQDFRGVIVKQCA